MTEPVPVFLLVLQLYAIQVPRVFSQILPEAISIKPNQFDESTTNIYTSISYNERYVKFETDSSTYGQPTDSTFSAHITKDQNTEIEDTESTFSKSSTNHEDIKIGEEEAITRFLFEELSNNNMEVVNISAFDKSPLSSGNNKVMNNNEKLHTVPMFTRKENSSGDELEEGFFNLTANITNTTDNAFNFSSDYQTIRTSIDDNHSNPSLLELITPDSNEKANLESIFERETTNSDLHQGTDFFIGDSNAENKYGHKPGSSFDHILTISTLIDGDFMGRNNGKILKEDNEHSSENFTGNEEIELVTDLSKNDFTNGTAVQFESGVSANQQSTIVKTTEMKPKFALNDTNVIPVMNNTATSSGDEPLSTEISETFVSIGLSSDISTESDKEDDVTTINTSFHTKINSDQKYFSQDEMLRHINDGRSDSVDNDSNEKHEKSYNDEFLTSVKFLSGEESGISTDGLFLEELTEKQMSNNLHGSATTDFSTYVYTLPSDAMDSTDADFTRVPKKIEGKQSESRPRPMRPDPGYNSYSLQAEYARPYRPDSPSYERPYFRPTPDYRTPLIRQNQDQKPIRPDQDYGRPSFKDDSDTSRLPFPLTERVKEPTESDYSKLYRPSASRPNRPQSSSFSRPYRPEFHKPVSSYTEYPVVSKSDYPESYDIHDDRKYINPRPSDTMRDVEKTKSNEYDGLRTFRPLKGQTIISEQSKTSKPADSVIRQTSKIEEWSKPSMLTESDEDLSKFEDSQNPTKFDGGDVYRKPSIYPRPGFGSNYADKIVTTSAPFSMAGAIVSSRNLTRVEVIKADCFDNHMKVTVQFNGSFEGLVYSSGYSHDPSCSYINGSGRNHYEFFIRLNRCGTLGQQEVTQQQRALSFSRKRQERAQYLVNTVTVQYNPLIEEDIDEHFRVTCEYGYNFWKTVTFPIISVESSEVKLRTGNPVVFTLPPPQCNMEIRSGYGPTGNRITGPVNVGDPLTLVIHMKSETPGFDILVSNCVAHNGGQKRLKLVDSNGCVVQEKLISAFRGVSGPDRLQQLTLYSYLKAFRFTGSPALYIECDVHMCHGSCPPQRCYWRHLYKRSIANYTEESTADSSSTNVLSESVSLFQALEVRHDDVDAPSALSGRQKSFTDEEGVVCMRTVGFTAMFTSLLLLLFLSCFVSICLCSRMRKIKHEPNNYDSNYFVSFDGHTALK